MRPRSIRPVRLAFAVPAPAAAQTGTARVHLDATAKVWATPPMHVIICDMRHID
ncbi:MAG: hypothetical protein AAFY56_22205 [Pseudomonadota bacterium]